MSSSFEGLDAAFDDEVDLSLSPSLSADLLGGGAGGGALGPPGPLAWGGGGDGTAAVEEAVAEMLTNRFLTEITSRLATRTRSFSAVAYMLRQLGEHRRSGLLRR
jgi:hypothetical protein